VRLWPRSLRAGIALAAVAALAGSLLLAGVLLLGAIERDGREAVDRRLLERAERVAGRRGARPGPPGGGAFGPAPPGSGERRGGGRRRRDSLGPAYGRRPDGPEQSDDLLEGSRTFVRVLSGGQVIRERGDVPAQAPPLPAGEGFSTVSLDGELWRSLVVAPRRAPGVRVQVFESLEIVERQVGRTRLLVVGFGLLALVLTALAAWAATSLLLRPLARLRAAAAGVSDTEDLRSRLPEQRRDPDEVRALTGSLNEMLGRLESSASATDRALQATRRFAADAGHELRTPMAGLQANLDYLVRNPELDGPARREALAEMQTAQRRMVALLEGLQALARGEAAEAVPRESVELGDLIDAALHDARRRHPGVRFELADAGGETVVEGWPDGLRMLTDNLLDNAARHGRPDGRVKVELRPDGDETLELSVDDDGPGLAPDQRTRVLEPFERGPDRGVAGSGLGLAVVAQQAALHAGAVTLGDGELGGLRATVRLPLAPRLDS